MANYLYIDNYSNKGRLGISLSSFNSLVESALGRIKDIAPSKGKLKRNQRVYFNRPVQCSILLGILHVAVYIDVKKGSDIQEISKKINDEVTSTLLVATEQVPFDVQVKVTSLF